MELEVWVWEKEWPSTLLTPPLWGQNSNFGPQTPKREDWEAGVLSQREAKAEASVLGLLRVEQARV